MKSTKVGIEADYMESAKSKAIRRQVNDLCQEVRKDAVGLVNAFGIPDQYLGAPIVTEKN